MNLNMIRLEYKTKKLLLSTTKDCETLNKQTHKKPQKDFKI